MVFVQTYARIVFVLININIIYVAVHFLNVHVRAYVFDIIMFLDVFWHTSLGLIWHNIHRNSNMIV